MFRKLQEKLKMERPAYTLEEINWLIRHIGDPAPEIRDDLVFNSLARGIQEELFSIEQFHYLAKSIIKDEGLLFEIETSGNSTLTRSFKALIYANLLAADRFDLSLYFRQLDPQIKEVIFQEGLVYLTKERDTQGFSDSFGWVHAFAHGADLVTEIVSHPDFPNSSMPEILSLMERIFKQQTSRFSNDEDWRLARVFSEAILLGKLSQTQLANWVQGLDFPLESVEDYYRFSNMRSCLLEVYILLNKDGQLSNQLKEAIQLFHY